MPQIVVCFANFILSTKHPETLIFVLFSYPIRSLVLIFMQLNVNCLHYVHFSWRNVTIWCFIWIKRKVILNLCDLMQQLWIIIICHYTAYPLFYFDIKKVEVSFGHSFILLLNWAPTMYQHKTAHRGCHMIHSRWRRELLRRYLLPIIFTCVENKYIVIANLHFQVAHKLAGTTKNDKELIFIGVHCVEVSGACLFDAFFVEIKQGPCVCRGI